jgi:galacturan 1,4-alpha-galacturonidase
MGFGFNAILFSLLGLGLLTAAVPTDHDNTCVVIPLGHNQDDVPNILAAVEKCGSIPGGKIVLPAPYVYSINQRMTTRLEGSTLEIRGTLRFSDDMAYWINNSYRFDFQNQSTAWRVTGSDYVVDGGEEMGGIDGNGQIWYTWAKNAGNVFGRPMPLHIVNSTRATFKNLSIRQQQFWAVLVESSSYIVLDNFYVNATNHDPTANGSSHYVQNTDGIDTYRSDHITIKNWVYQGGDDAVALKGNSTNIHIENITVYGGPGIAFGSLGQYPTRYDIVENVTVKNINVRHFS